MEITMKCFSNVTWISLNAHNTNEIGRPICHSSASRPLVKRLLDGRASWCFYCFYK